MKLSKTIERKTKSTRPSNRYFPVKIHNLSSPYIKRAGTHIFAGGNEVSVFEVSDYRALNQIVGYAKFINTQYGDVFYRGEVNLHSSLLPSIARKTNRTGYEKSLQFQRKSYIIPPFIRV